MRALILAAGRGSRLQSSTDACPKCLVPWNGRTLLGWHLRALAAVGVHEIAIVTGYRREALHLHTLREFINANWANSTVVDSLVCADDWLSEDVCLALYSDIVFSPKVLRKLIEPYPLLAVASYPKWHDLWSKRFDDPLSDAETFRTSESGLITEIGGKPTSVHDIEGQFMGIVQFQPETWSKFKCAIEEFCSPFDRSLDMTGLLSRVVTHNWMPVLSVDVDGTWAEFDVPSDFAAADAFLPDFISEFPESH